MRKLFLLFLILLFIGCSNNKEEAVSDNKSVEPINNKQPVILIGDKTVYSEDIINFAYYLLQEIDDKDKNDKLIKEKIINDYINHYLLLAEAKKSDVKVDKSKVNEVLEKFNTSYGKESLSAFTSKTQLDLSKTKEIIYENMLIQAYLNKIISENLKIEKEDLKNYYDNYTKNSSTKTLYHVWHIFIRDEKKAKKARELLRQRNSFKKIAQQYSEDPYAERGGDMGYIDIDIMPKVFEYVKKMRVRRVSKIIKSDFGYHIFSLRDKVKSTSKGSLEELSGEIYSKVYEIKQNELIENLIKELRKNVEIKVIGDIDFTFKPDNSSQNN